MSGAIGPHNGRELELLRAGKKPAAWLDVRDMAEPSSLVLEDLRRDGFLFLWRQRLTPLPTLPGQLQLDLDPSVLETYPRELFIARDQQAMTEIVGAADHGTWADVGRALGYSEEDLAAYARRLSAARDNLNRAVGVV